MSKTVVVQYTTRPEVADENQRLLERVFAQLDEQHLEGIRYTTFRLEDGVTFVHVAITDDAVSPLTQLPAFTEYLEGIDKRLVEPVSNQTAKVVGSYRFVSE